jgi:hypothetical protein
MAPRCLEKVRLSQIDLSLEGQAGKPWIVAGEPVEKTAKGHDG